MASHLFRTEYSFEDRKTKADDFLKDNPDRVPIVLEAADGCTLKLSKTLFLVAKTKPWGSFLCALRKNCQLEPTHALFCFVGKNHILPAQASLMSQLYAEHKDVDGFLYITYTEESTFGFSLK